MAGYLLFAHTLTPLHCGVGQQVGIVDLPVAREAVTGWPYVPGSSIKGVLRDQAQRAGWKEDDLREIFGSGPEETAREGSVSFPDLLVLAWPVRSLYGTFTWTTCPFALARLERDGAPRWEGLSGIGKARMWTTSTSKVAEAGEAILEDLPFTVEGPENTETVDSLAKWIASQVFEEDKAWQSLFQERFAVIDDDTFSYLSFIGTDVRARVRIGQTGTVEPGALWYEEAVPAETIFVAPVLTTSTTKQPSEDIYQKLRNLVSTPIQLGGGVSVGRGMIRLYLRKV
jgi:CRISPR-associated protein Cmr4